MSIHQSQAEILNKEELAPGVFRLKLFSEEIAAGARPGQFVHIACGKERRFILRRPFGIHRKLHGNAFEILFQVKGAGTRALSEARLHDALDVLGPLGRPFVIPEKLTSALVVAGGLGVAPMVFLVDELVARKTKLRVLQGAATRQQLLCHMDLKRVGRVYTSTDDGTAGYRGKVTDLLHEAITHAAPDQIFACGPEPMLKRVADVAASYGVGCQVSIERRMACGVGACLSCVCETVDGYRLACKDGPVFRAEELNWRGRE